MLTSDKFTNLFQQLDVCLARHPTSIYALRDANSRYLAASPEYLQLLFSDQSAPLPASVLYSSLDLATKHSLIFKDQQVIRRLESLCSLEPIISDGRLMVLEVYRYPLLELDKVVALGVVAQHLASPSHAVFEYSQLPVALLAETCIRPLNQREWLIGLFLLQNWTAVAIAKYLGISSGRMTEILSRICRYKFGVSGGAKRYRQTLIETGLYKQIPPELLIQHALSCNESLQ